MYPHESRSFFSIDSHSLVNAVSFKAQVLLCKMFAMELVELQPRNCRVQDPAEDLQNATGVKKVRRPFPLASSSSF